MKKQIIAPKKMIKIVWVIAAGTLFTIMLIPFLDYVMENDEFRTVMHEIKVCNNPDVHYEFLHESEVGIHFKQPDDKTYKFNVTVRLFKRIKKALIDKGYSRESDGTFGSFNKQHSFEGAANVQQ